MELDALSKRNPSHKSHVQWVCFWRVISPERFNFLHTTGQVVRLSQTKFGPPLTVWHVDHLKLMGFDQVQVD